MKTIKEIREEILKEIKERRELKAGMVGTLYPSILEDEIEKLINALEML